MSRQYFPQVPPSIDFFDCKRPSAGNRCVSLVLGPLSINIRGLDEAMADELFDHYAPFSTREAPEGAVRIRLGIEDRDYFISPPDEGTEFTRVQLRYESDSRRVVYQSYRMAGWFDTLGGEGVALLASGDWEPFIRAMENYVRSTVAWQAASRGGALVHAASAVLEGRGYLFYGESGAGKSTLSECNTRAKILSDDISLLLPGDDGRLQLVGSPFRGTYVGGEPVMGTFPLTAGFRIVQAKQAAVQEVPRIRALSEFVGNMPFVAEAFSSRPDLFENIEKKLLDTPLAHLCFCKDDSYWDAIAEWERQSG